MITPLTAFVDGLKVAADRATVAEETFRREIATRTKELERQRAFAFRRLNLVRAVADAVAGADSEEVAVACASAVLRTRLGWASDSEARDEVLSHFAPVARAMFGQLVVEELDHEPPDAGDVLETFEAWYAASHPVAFWVLFENVMSETPVVDF